MMMITFQPRLLLASVKKTITKLKQSRVPVAILPSSISIQQVKGSGPGGQAVNKTNNAVAITHNETGIRVKYHATRYAAINKKLAHKRLLEELDNRINGIASKRNIRTMLQKERKRIKKRKSVRKHSKQEKQRE